MLFAEEYFIVSAGPPLNRQAQHAASISPTRLSGTLHLDKPEVDMLEKVMSMTSARMRRVQVDVTELPWPSEDIAGRIRVANGRSYAITMGTSRLSFTFSVIIKGGKAHVTTSHGSDLEGSWKHRRMNNKKRDVAKAMRALKKVIDSTVSAGGGKGLTIGELRVIVEALQFGTDGHETWLKP